MRLRNTIHDTIGVRRCSVAVLMCTLAAILVVGGHPTHADTASPAKDDRNAQLPLVFRGLDDLSDDQVRHIIAIQKNVDDQVAQLRKLAIADQEVLLTDRQKAEVEEARAKGEN